MPGFSELAADANITIVVSAWSVSMCADAGAIDALTLLDKYIAPGCVLLFDDLINYPGYREHEILALWEWLETTGRKLEVLTLMLSLVLSWNTA